ncbi:MAG: hypothetical protein J1F64_02490 [Oscillospiraceae bacterium]|nr:hypothetical protein [Oscillospiraceae bacterium]
MTNSEYRKMLIDKFSDVKSGDFSQKEAIDLLVLTVCPKKDTERISNELIEKFGCRFSDIIDAETNETVKIKGINVQAAEFIHLIPKIARVCARKSNGGRVKITNGNVGRYALNLMMNRDEEVFYVISLDKSGYVISEDIVNRGAVSSVIVNLKELSKAILSSDAYAVLLVHNHPGGKVSPSKEDIDVTAFLAEYIRKLNMILIDHLIVNDNDYYSMRKHYPSIFFG